MTVPANRIGPEDPTAAPGRRRSWGAFVSAALSAAIAALIVPPGASALAQDASGEPVVSEVPDACELLVREDVSELLGEEVGEGERYDVSGFPCVYRGASGRRLTLVAHLGRGAEIEGTQPGKELEYCEAEVVREVDGLGVAGALYRGTKETAGCGGHTLWVSTGVRFVGKIHPEQLREVDRRFHFVLSLEPAADEAERAAVLAEAAGRALARLRDRAR